MSHCANVLARFTHGQKKTPTKSSTYAVHLPGSCFKVKLLELWSDSGLKFSFQEGFSLNCVSTEKD
jgi:hypothetical protein